MSTILRAAESGYRYAVKADFEILDCSACGVPFGAPRAYLDRRRNDGQSFYCPNGHGQSWRETEADRQRKRAEEAERNARGWREVADATDRNLAAERRTASALRGHLTRMRNRIAAGVCPVPGCHRTGLTQTRRHIETKHPDWWAEHEHDLA